MRVLVFGASGLTGQQLLDAARHGHTVTAFVRNPATFHNQHGVEVVPSSGRGATGLC